MKHLIAPSILAADFSQLGNAITMIDESDADWVHCDVMDGNFVPNISFGFPVLKSIRKFTDKPFDVHLMLKDPDNYLEDFKRVGADHITVHYEACTHLDRTLRRIRELGMKSGVALNPSTPVENLRHVLHLADIVLPMTVNPGFGGQKFIPYVLEKIKELKEMITVAKLATLIEVDGGVDDQTAGPILRAGADVLVAGSYVFKAAEPKQVISTLKHFSISKTA